MARLWTSHSGGGGGAIDTVLALEEAAVGWGGRNVDMKTPWENRINTVGPPRNQPSWLPPLDCVCDTLPSPQFPNL